MESHPFMAGHADWVATNERLTRRDLDTIAADTARLARVARFLVVVPLTLPEPLVRAALDSLLEQVHPTWYLGLLGDPARATGLRDRLEKIERVTKRRVAMSDEPGGSLAGLLRGTSPAPETYVLFLDAGQRLSPHALHVLASAIESEPGAAFLYSDEDVVDAGGERRSPFFKPAWSPDFFVEHDYVSSACAYRAGGLLALGDDIPESSPEITLALLASLPSDKVGHVPHILFHLPSSPPERRRDREFVERYLSARGETAEVLPRVTPGEYRVRHALPERAPLVSVIISTRDQPAALDRCLQTLTEKTDYEPYEILVVDNDSQEPETQHFLSTLQSEETARVLRVPGPFNFSAIQNRAVRYARGEVLCFLNDDTEIVSPGWLGEMVRQAMRPRVGIVGAMLYYPDRSIQHAGVVLGTGLAEIAGHAYRGVHASAASHYPRLRTVQNYSAVTAACLVVRRDVFFAVGGFDEDLASNFNDVDFCLRVRRRGHRVVWTPDAELVHAEALSRARSKDTRQREQTAREIAHVTKRFGALLQDDPAYNPNLSLFHEDFRPALRTRAVRPWEPEPPDEAPELSVVLPTHDRLESLRRVVEALEAQTDAPRFELIVIDDGSSDGTKDWLQQHAFRMPTWVRHQSGRGPAAARNAGVEAARGRWLALLDDDTVPAPDWLARLREAHREHGDLDTVAVLGRTDWHHRRRQTRFASHIGKNGLQFGFVQIETPEDLPFTFFYGCNLSIDRLRLLAEPFETSFPYPAWEDIELGYRHIRAGARLVYAPDARVAHDHPGAMRHFWRRQERAGFSAVIFARLHPELESMFALEPDGPPPRQSGLRRLGRLALAQLSERLPIDQPRLWEDVARDYFVDGLHRGWQSIMGRNPRRYEAVPFDSRRAAATSSGKARGPKFYVDRVSETEDDVTVDGWAIWPDQADGLIELTLGSEQDFYVLRGRRIERRDVAGAHGLESPLCGFEARVYKRKLRPGSYRAALVLSNAGFRTVVHDLDTTVTAPSRWAELRLLPAPRPDVPAHGVPWAR